MKMSVSTRTSATIPLVTAGHGGVRIRTEGRRQFRSRVAFRLQVRVERAPNDLGHRYALSLRDLIDHPTLMVRQVDLRSGGRHTAAIYSIRRSNSDSPCAWNTANRCGSPHRSGAGLAGPPWPPAVCAARPTGGARVSKAAHRHSLPRHEGIRGQGPWDVSGWNLTTSAHRGAIPGAVPAG